MPAQQINPLPGSVQQQGGQVQQRLYGGAARASARPSTCRDFFVRKTGSDTNGGSSASITPDSQGTDGVTNGTTTFTAASGTFTQADVNKLIMIGTKARYRITAVGSSTSITLSGSPSAGSGLTWKVGGAVLTILALMGSAQAPAGTILGGDRIFIGAGVYRESGNITSTGPTPTFELQINGDVTGQYTGDAGMVQISGWTTNDKTGNAQAIVTLASKSNYTFQDICFVGSTATPIATTGTTANVTFRNCSFLSPVGQMSLTVGYQTYSNIRVENCIFGPSNAGISISCTLTTGIGSHFDAGIFVVNCLFHVSSGTSIQITNSGTLAGRGGGVRVSGCSFLGGGTGVSVNTANISTGIPVRVIGCLFLGMNVGLTANTSGQIVEQQNYIAANVARSAVGVGAGSTPGADSGVNTSWAPLCHFGQEALWGAMPRQLGEPMVNSPFLGFGVDNGAADLLGRPRPAGNNSFSATTAVGALQRGNTAVADASPIGGGTTPIQITGPGFEDFYVPVPARAITVSCSVRFTGTPARLEVLENPAIGVVGQSVVAAGLPNVVQTITLDPFTPTAAGNMVTVRIYNPDPSGSSVLEVDDFLVTG